MSAAEEWYAMRDALALQVDLGADEAIADAPIRRYDQEPPQEAQPAAPAPEQRRKEATAAQPVLTDDASSDTQALADAADTLPELHRIMSAFEGCALRKGALNFVFSDGLAAARLMIVGEAPGAEEDRLGKPFVGKSGQLLDRMLAAIGLDRSAEEPSGAAYITNVIPWRPPGNRDPSAEEITMMRPFLMRHIELAAPDVLLLLGNPAMKTVLGTKTGITRMRGTWAEAGGRPALASFHPAALLRDPLKKRDAWTDLQMIRRRLDGRDGA